MIRFTIFVVVVLAGACGGSDRPPVEAPQKKGGAALEVDVNVTPAVVPAGVASEVRLSATSASAVHGRMTALLEKMESGEWNPIFVLPLVPSDGAAPLAEPLPYEAPSGGVEAQVPAAVSPDARAKTPPLIAGGTYRICWSLLGDDARSARACAPITAQ